MTGTPTRRASARALSAHYRNRPEVRKGWGLALSISSALAPGLAGCDFDRADRWLALPDASLTTCQEGSFRCIGEELQRCLPSLGGPHHWSTQERCQGQNAVCSATQQRCTHCERNSRRCDANVPLLCSNDGDSWQPQQACELNAGQLCRGGQCVNLCENAKTQQSNVGCEYWAVDLDNAVISNELNAASQQFGVVISNPQKDARVQVTIEQDNASVGDTPAPATVIREEIGPLGLRVFPLGPREVDGSPEGQYNEGTHSALTRAAYRITSNLPVVAYQFNPLQNVNVFSNDASLLKPVEALGIPSTELSPAYVVLGWPQTIANTENPATNFVAGDSELRGFLTVVGTRPATRVRIHSSTDLVLPPGLQRSPDGTLELTMGPFDTLNLETQDFNADFTGSRIDADGPLVVFSGSEASDAPAFEDLGARSCCADHLEEQLDPIRTAGRRFVAPVSNSRSLAVREAGAEVGVVAAPETFRVIAAHPEGATVTTTLAGDARSFRLGGQGSYKELSSDRDFLLESDTPVMLSSVSPSQERAGIPRGLPGGDPSLLLIPPIEQFREDYVFLTPSDYAFDFVRVIVPRGAEVVLDGQLLEETPGCSDKNPVGLNMTLPQSAREQYSVFRCQLSFPVLDDSAGAEQLVSPGRQNDGVHQLTSNMPVGVLVDGFDRNVSYAYAAGTELKQIDPTSAQ